MSDLAAFLLQRIAEDEATARFVLSGYAKHAAKWDCPVTGVVNIGDPGIDGLQPLGDGPLAEHVARWDPARVLAECEAKRRIVELHKPIKGEAQFDDDEYNTLTCDECFGDGTFISWPCPTLRLLALPYRDHPDYDPEWSPDSSETPGSE